MGLRALQGMTAVKIQRNLEGDDEGPALFIMEAEKSHDLLSLRWSSGKPVGGGF